MIIRAEQLKYENTYELSKWCGGLGWRKYNENTGKYEIGIAIKGYEDLVVHEGDWIIEHDDHFDLCTPEQYAANYA
jgi:hypothetical protein